MEEKKKEQPSGQGDGRSTVAMRTRSCEGTARSCQPAAMLPPTKKIKKNKEESNKKRSTLTNICIHNFEVVS